MAQRQTSSSGNSGVGNHQPHLLYPLHTMQMHAQNLHHQQQHQQQRVHHPPARSDPTHAEMQHHMERNLQTPNSRINPNTIKSGPYPPHEYWRSSLPNTFHSPKINPNAYTLPSAEDGSFGLNREVERDQEARRINVNEQVRKHFEESFRIANQKCAVQTRYAEPKSLQPPARIEEIKGRTHGVLGSSSVPSSPNKAYSTMVYGSIGQGSLFPDMPGKKSMQGAGPSSPLSVEYGRSDGDPLRYYATHMPQRLPIIRPCEPISSSMSRDLDKYSNSNHGVGSKHSYGPTYGPPAAVNRVKVSSPAPQQIYGKPNIPASNSPLSARNYDSESSPLSLTSKVSTRPTPTPPLPSSLTHHEGRGPDLANYYIYPLNASNGPTYSQNLNTAHRYSPKPDYQTQPLDLGGKRKTEPRHPESETKKLKSEEASIALHNQVLNLVKGEMGIDQPRTSVSPAPSLLQVASIDLNCIKEGGLNSAPTESKSEVLISDLPGNEQASEVVSLPMPNQSSTPECYPLKSTVYETSSSPSHGIHKGKKVFLQRHSGQDAVADAPSSDTFLKNGATTVTSSIVVTNAMPNAEGEGPGCENATLKSGLGSKAQRKAEKEDDGGVSNGHHFARRRHTSSTDSEGGTKCPPKRPRPKKSRTILSKDKSSNADSTHSDSEKDSHTSDSNLRDKEVVSNENLSSTVPVKKRGRKPRAEPKESPTKTIKKSNPFKRPAIHMLKRTGDSFLQDGPCSEVAPKLGKCRECRQNGSKTKKHSNIFCRFYAFRKLRYTKNGSLAIAGFSDPFNDPTPEDTNLWLPSKAIGPEALELDMAKFLVDQLGDQFCELIQQEKEALDISVSQEEDLIAWKRVVQGVREMCDVCDTTLFNLHWACKKCGFVVCIACYRGRKQGTIKSTVEHGKERDEYQWLFCSTRQTHEIESLMLTQAVAGQALTSLGELLHRMREAWNIAQECDCKDVRSIKSLKHNKVGSHDVSVIKTEHETFPKGDVVDNAYASTLTPAITDRSDESENDDDDEGRSALLKILSANPTTESLDTLDDNKNRESAVFVPTAKPEAKEGDTELSLSKTKPLKHFVRRKDTAIRREKEPPAVTPYSLCQTTKLFPEVPHSWLCFGKLLHLHDPLHPENQKIFQEIWKRGQPVIVSHVSDRLNKHLWSPESFLKDFSELKNDLVNCTTGRILAKQPMKKFWEGFEYVSKRLKDEKGNPMLLKLKDWPPGEDFAESLPSRYKDLMACLPLPDYTNRTGRLNLASRLPDNFVRPDLGPKMYIAYGSGTNLEKGTTNLHLDISDAVNLMVHVGVPKDIDNKEAHKAVLEAIEQSDVDGATVDRVKEDGDLPGALWHIYNTRDADKIRDLLNMVALERGVALEAHHDPIHDQSWYLDKTLRQRLVEEYNVMGYPIVQFMGDAVFIPAGAPHQVRNLHSCIKIAEDFVSPENVSHCFHLTEEFRNLTETHSNHEDKLQIKNIIYHAVKDAVSVLQHSLAEQQAVSEAKEGTRAVAGNPADEAEDSKSPVGTK